MAAGPVGDLRMVLNLEKIVPSPYFRSYWIQRNITDMQQYSAAVSDLFRSGGEYREDRVLVKKSAAAGNASANDAAAAVADLARLVPADTGTYEVRAIPSAADCLNVLETKILAPHRGPAVAQRTAPNVQLSSGETGSSSDLETRIDQAPLKTSASSDASTPLRELFQKSQVRAILQVQATERDMDGVFVHIHSGVAFLAAADWPEAAVRSALVDFLRPSLTTASLGLQWQSKSGHQEFDGLWNFAVAVRGKYLLVSDDSTVLRNMFGNMNQKLAQKPAVLVAGFHHAREPVSLTARAQTPAVLRHRNLIPSSSRTISRASAPRWPAFLRKPLWSATQVIKSSRRSPTNGPAEDIRRSGHRGTRDHIRFLRAFRTDSFRRPGYPRTGKVSF